MRRLPAIAAWIFSILFVSLAAAEHFRRGAPARPRNISSLSGTNPRSSDESMALMLDARRLIPPNARVATLRPRARHQDNLLFMAASGQLPRHLVVGADALVSDQPPDFVIALEARFDDPRFDLMHETPGGGIWRRIR